MLLPEFKAKFHTDNIPESFFVAESNALGVVRPAPLSSQMSIVGDRNSLEHVTDWRIVVKQYISNNLTQAN